MHLDCRALALGKTWDHLWHASDHDGTSDFHHHASRPSPSATTFTSCWIVLADMRPLTVTLLMSDDDFSKLISGKANAQKLFMSGKLKVKGDVMKATKAEPILKKASTAAKL